MSGWQHVVRGEGFGEPLVSRKAVTTMWAGGMGSSRRPPFGSGLALTKRDSWAPGRFCMLTICWSEDKADRISGSRSRGNVRVTVFSRNSLANTVWAEMEESPSKVEMASSSCSRPYIMSLVPLPPPAAGEEPKGTGPRPADPLSVAEAEGLLLVMETARSRSMFSIFARRDSKWSIFRSLYYTRGAHLVSIAITSHGQRM